MAVRPVPDRSSRTIETGLPGPLTRPCIAPDRRNRATIRGRMVAAPAGINRERAHGWWKSCVAAPRSFI